MKLFKTIIFVAIIALFANSCKTPSYYDAYIKATNSSLQEVNKIILQSDRKQLKYYDSVNIRKADLFYRDANWNMRYFKNGNVQSFYKHIFIDSFTYDRIIDNDTSYIDSVGYHDIGYYFYENGMLQSIRALKNDSCFNIKNYSIKGKLNESSYCK